MKTGHVTRRKMYVLVVVGALLALAASVSQAAIGRGEGAEAFAATFDARAVGDPTITSCPGLGPDGLKIERRYEGTFTIPAEERRLAARFSLEILFDRSTGVGTAEGNWQLLDPPDPDIVARGGLITVVKALDPPDPDLDPPDPDLGLHGLVIGSLDPPDPDLPTQRLLGNFAASLGDGATFPHLKGTVGDPTNLVGDPTVGDSTGLASDPAVLLPAVKC
jgi:hypothetical protein